MKMKTNLYFWEDTLPDEVLYWFLSDKEAFIYLTQISGF